MKVLQIIGADLSKESIDLACHDQENHLKIENSSSGFKRMIEWFRQQKINTSEMMMVMEHTGHCSYHLEAFLHEHQIRFAKVSALAIKRSLGMIRGKNDKIDAKRIARFGFEKKDLLVAAVKADPALERLQMLHSSRRLLVRHCGSLKCSLKEYKRLLKPTDLIIKTQVAAIKTLEQQTQKLDQEIEQLIRTSEPVCRNFELLESIVGVGPVVAVAAIVKTGNFTRFANARKFACYCGTAPFDHSSGTSIRKKTRISHLADKEMKTLLDQAAKSAIQYDAELKTYYTRRIEQGKSKKSTINIVRTKLIARMFAVIKRQSPFEKSYQRAA
jgi:transposase